MSFEDHDARRESAFADVWQGQSTSFGLPPRGE
jgi:hypothetical protein